MGRGTSKATSRGDFETEQSLIPIGPQSTGQSKERLKNLPDKQIERSVRSTRKAIEKHKQLIKNPELKDKDFYKKDIRYQKGLINWWKKEIEGQEKQLADFENELKRRHNK